MTAIVLVVTQGNLGRELVAAARNIVGDMPHVSAVDLRWDATFEEDSDRLRQALDRFGTSRDILVLTDMSGSTPHNVAMEFHRPGRVEVVSGANLPMIVRLGCMGATDRSLEELAQWISEKARRSICTTTSARLDPVDVSDQLIHGKPSDRKDPCDG